MRSPCPTSAEEFYRQRDDRTERASGVGRFAGATVSVSIGAREARRPSGQVLLLLTVNLLARWCRRIVLDAPAVGIDPGLLRDLGLTAGTTLDAAALALARAADPFGSFESGGARAGMIQLHVGPDRTGEAFNLLGRGWLALCGDAALRGDDEPDETRLGAVLAACVGTAWAFRAALGHAPLPSAVRLSLFDFGAGAAAGTGPVPPNPSVGRVLLVGCGAVGSAIAYLWPLAGLRGELILVDADGVEVSNLNRSPLFRAGDVGADKVDAVAAHLARCGRGAERIPAWFDEALEQGIMTPRPDVVIPAANERNVRERIQYQVPPLQIYGTTGRNWDVFLGRHRPLREDCLVCRFPRRKAPGPAMACATASLPTASRAPDGAPDVALPFASTAAAVLAVAELVKAAGARATPGPNFVALDFLGALDGFFVEQRSPVAGCLCGMQREVWQRLNGTTRFHQISCDEG